CMSTLMTGGQQGPGEIRIDIERGRLRSAAWVTASVLGREGEWLLFYLRPARPDDRRRRSPEPWRAAPNEPGSFQLQVRTLGRLGLERPSGPIDGPWLQQRPGQLLQLLLCNRHRP